MLALAAPTLAQNPPTGQGSHDVAVETLRHESVLIFVAFGLSLVSMIVCACAMAVIAFGPGAAAACAVFMTSLLAQTSSALSQTWPPGQAFPQAPQWA